MKFLKTSLLIGVLYFLSGNITAQWYKLPAPNMPFSWRLGSCPCGLFLPYNYIVALANGVIAYDIQCQAGSNGTYEIMESHNDLGTDTSVFGESGMGCCGGEAMCSSNDSIHAFIESTSGILSLYYTRTDFTNITGVPARIAPFGGPISITKNYIYTISQCSFEFPDSLFVNKTNISANSYSYFASYKDSGFGKLSFVNDSVGFLISAHRGDFKTTFLLKSTDYGATWNPSFYDSTHSITDFSFPYADTGYLIKDNDSLFKTIDGGTTWSKLVVPSGTYTCIQFANGQIGYIGGRRGSLIQTTNGGVSWTPLNSGDNITISSLYTFGTSVAYFVDSVKNVYKNQIPLSVPKTEQLPENISLFPNPNNGSFHVVLQDFQQIPTIEIYNVLGQKIYTTTLSTSKNYINLPNKQKGLYLYRILSQNGGLLLEGKFVIM